MLTPWHMETLTHNMEVVFGRGASVLHDSKYGPSHHLSVNHVVVKLDAMKVFISRLLLLIELQAAMWH